MVATEMMQRYKKLQFERGESERQKQYIAAAGSLLVGGVWAVDPRGSTRPLGLLDFHAHSGFPVRREQNLHTLSSISHAETFCTSGPTSRRLWKLDFCHRSPLACHVFAPVLCAELDSSAT